MIKKIHIENFRNIKSLDLSFEEMTSIITGKNNIGKSNTLNALMWFLTDTLLTDKWGSGENDIMSIIPIDMKKGEHTMVTITLDSGAEFTKYYKRGYDKETGKPNKHTTEFKINGATCKNATEFTNKLFSEGQLSYAPRIKNATDIKELNLMIDPLYALQKLDSKSLRLLLVELGCSVTNEEVFASDDRFEVLKNDEKTYLGDFTAMRVALKQERKTAEDDINADRVLLKSVNDVEEFDGKNLKELEEKQAALKVRIKELESGDLTNLIKDLNLEKQKVKLEKNSFIETETAKKESQLKLLDEKIEIARTQAERAKNEKNQSINNKIKELNQTKQSLEARKLNYETVRVNCKKDYARFINDAEILANELANYKAKLIEASERTFNGFVVCPHCGKSFAPDQNAFDNFNDVKNKDINRIQNNITQTEIKINENKKKQDQICVDGSNAFNELTKINAQINDIDAEIIELKSKLGTSVEVDYTEFNRLCNERNRIKDTAINTAEFDEKIVRIQATIDRTILDSRKENEEKIYELESESSRIRALIETEYTNKSRWASKQKYLNSLDLHEKNLNEIEYKLELVNDFIHTMIAMINAKAKEITGIEFVMLEENLGNERLKEVCYATVDGVPFKDVNTSQKLIVGINFIQRIKQILGSNELPILADRLEGFDSVKKIKALTSEQLICTRVGTDEMKNITII